MNDAFGHQIVQAGWEFAIARLVATDPFFQKPNVSLRDHFFHPLHQALSQALVLQLLVEPLQKFECRIWIAGFDRHPGGQFGQVRRSARQFGSHPQVYRRLDRVMKLIEIVIPHIKRKLPNIRVMAHALRQQCDALCGQICPDTQNDPGRLVCRGKLRVQIGKHIHRMIRPEIPFGRLLPFAEVLNCFEPNQVCGNLPVTQHCHSEVLALRQKG